MSQEHGAIRIGIAEAKTKIDSGEAVALDVVQSTAWRQVDGAVKGAVRIPPQDIGRRYGELPRQLDVITYCT